jgi:CRP/FNR family cyclic AMP-dependent transcriptional regulator
MPCDPETLKQVPLFAQLDEEETAVLASQVEVKEFAPRQRIYKAGTPGGRGYVVVLGAVRVVAVDEDGQEVTVDEPGAGEFFGFASMLEGTPHQTDAIAVERTVSIEVDRADIEVLLRRKPLAGMDMLGVLGKQYHAAEMLVRRRSARNPNDVIEEEASIGERIADTVARFGGSWGFIITFAIVMSGYAWLNVHLDRAAWDPYPFILLNLFLSMLAALQAPVIMMSQNRQDKKDRLRGELDYEVNRRAASDIQGLARKLNLLGERIEDVEELVRDKLR